MEKQGNFCRLVKKTEKTRSTKILIKNYQNDDIIFGHLCQAAIYELKSGNEKNEKESVIFKTINKEGMGLNTLPK